MFNKKRKTNYLQANETADKVINSSKTTNRKRFEELKYSSVEGWFNALWYFPIMCLFCGLEFLHIIQLFSHILTLWYV